MINLLVKSHAESKLLLQLRHVSKILTTVVLSVYIVGSAAFLGYSLYQTNKTERVSNELVQLTDQVTARAVEEVFVRKLYAKSVDVKSFLSTRSPINDLINVLESYELKARAWQYTSGINLQKIEVVGNNPAEINNYVEYIKSKYDQVRLERLTLTPLEGWVGTIVIIGNLKQS